MPHPRSELAVPPGNPPTAGGSRGGRGGARAGVFAPALPLVADSVRARRAAPIFLWVPASGARGLAAFAEPRGPLPDSGLVSFVRPDNERDQNPHITRMRS